MSEEIELPIIVIHSSSYNYCQLPDSLSLSTSVPESVCAAPPLLGYQLLWPGQSAPFVSPWRPTSGTSSSPSPARASHSHSRSHLILYTDQKVDSNLHNGVIVKLLPILTAKTPSELYLQPKSEYDWEIVSTNATFIEQNLLRSLSLLYVGQTLCINISSSLTAELIVKSAKYDGEDSLTVSHRESIANSSDEESINSLEIVRLTLDTRLIVEPYVDKETKDKLTNELLLADACTTSDFYPLQVLILVLENCLI